MEANLTFSYSADADVLCIAKCLSYRGQEAGDIDDLVIARHNPDTGEIEYLEILFASKRIVSRNPVRLNIPIAAGAVNGYPAAPEFDYLADPGSQWLTLPAAAAAALEPDTRPPRFPTDPGSRPADVSRFQLVVEDAAAASA